MEVVKIYKQIIIARKDLHMSPGKLAAQVSHASMAFLTNAIRKNPGKYEVYSPDQGYIKTVYLPHMEIKADLYEQWICESFTKCVLEAKNKAQLMKATKIAESIGLKEEEDFFLIKDNCYTELVPEEWDEQDVGRTLTCIGFKPMYSEVIDRIGKRFQLYR